MDRFKADVKAGEAHPYNTGDVLPDFDFAAAKAEFEGLSPVEQAAVAKDWNDFVDLC